MRRPRPLRACAWRSRTPNARGSWPPPTAQRCAPLLSASRVRRLRARSAYSGRGWRCSQAVRARGDAAGAELESQAEAELELTARKERKRVEGEWGERAKRDAETG